MKNAILDIKRALLLILISLKYGLGPLVRRTFRLPSRGPGIPVRIRLAMEELGLTYLKLGQYLAMRFDILPIEVCRELHKLFEDVPPMPFDDVKAVVTQELHGPLEEFFSDFHSEPIAAATVAQVHEARIGDDQRVAVKIQRPGIQPVFAADMRNLRRIATISDTLGIFGTLSLREAAEEFAHFTTREMNFVTEGRTADRLRRNATSNEIVPKIFWEFTTKKVITMEFIEGVSLSQIYRTLETEGMASVRARLPNLNLEEALQNLAHASLTQLFLVGFFHADPHPGNILIRDDNTVAFVDFGIFGELTETQRETLAGYIENLSVGNIAESFRQYSKLYTPTVATDFKKFKQSAKTILNKWYRASESPYASVQTRHLGRYADQMLTVVRRNSLRMDIDTLLFWRALIALDSTALQMSAYFDLLNELRTFFGENSLSVSERFFGIINDPGYATKIVQLEQEIPGKISEIQETLGTAISRSYSKYKEMDTLHRTNNTTAKYFTLILTGTSFTILLKTLQVYSSLGLLILLITNVIFIGSFIKVWSK